VENVQSAFTRQGAIFAAGQNWKERVMDNMRDKIRSDGLTATASACWLALWVAGCTVKGDARIATEQVTTVDVREAAADAASLPSPPPPPVLSAPAPVSAGAAKNYAPQARMAMPGYHVPPVMVPVQGNTERYDGKDVSPVHQARTDPVSTFSVDVDTGAYANMRRYLMAGNLPPREAVRSEELINYFRYDYDRPGRQEAPFTVTTDVAASPWNADTRLLRIGLRGYDLPRSGRPPANLV
jgi:Ca-activated chloride channel homolog